MKKALPILTIVPANKAEEAGGTDGKHYIVSEQLHAIAPIHPLLSKIATAPFIEPMTP